MAETETETQQLRRKSATVTDYHEHYLVRDRTFGQQFNACYAARLRALEPAVRAQLTAAEAAACTRVADLRDDGHTHTVVGTLVKVARRLPNLLAEYAAARVITGFRWAQGAVYVDPADELYVEDASGRVRVAFGSVPAPAASEAKTGDDSKEEDKKEEKEEEEWAERATAELPTGVVVGLVGVYSAQGNRLVVPRADGVRTAGPRLCVVAEDAAGESAAAMAARGSRFVLLVSGLRFGDAAARPLCAHALAQWLAGNIGGAAERTLAAAVVHVIVAGNSVVAPDAAGTTGTGTGAVGTGTGTTEAPAARRSTALLAGALEQFEDVLTTVAASCPVDVMPGPCDPANNALPQQPMEKFASPQPLPLFPLLLVHCFCCFT